MIHFPRESLIFFTWFFFHTIHFSCKSFFTRFIFHMIHLFPWDSFVFMWPPPPTHTYTIKFFHVHFTSLPLLLYATFSHDSFARFVNFSWDFFFLNIWFNYFSLIIDWWAWFIYFYMIRLSHDSLFLHRIHWISRAIFVSHIIHLLPHDSFMFIWFPPTHTIHFFYVIFLHSSFNLTRFLTIHLNSHVLDSFIFHERFFSYARFNRFPLIINW